MSGVIRHLYVHVPFCPVKCSYCAFVSHVGSIKLLDPYVSALISEARTQSREQPGGPLETVYFGGGTPSMMEPRHLGRLLRGFDDLWRLAPDCEVTVEAHPATVDAGKLADFVRAGANRVSFGVESAQPEELRLLGRAHDADMVRGVVRTARRAGFGSMNLDLMYGIPAQTLKSWTETLRQVLQMSPDHLSLYPLQIEPKTVFGRRWRRHELQVPADERVVEMYHAACSELAAWGYVHYEAANWARPGHECAHNLAYWNNREYYAIGVGAHGYIGKHRVRNISQTKRYIERMSIGESPRRESTFICERDRLSETLMLGLRLLQSGIDLESVRMEFGVDVLEDMTPDARRFLSEGFLEVRDGKLMVSEAAIPVANEIWQQFV